MFNRRIAHIIIMLLVCAVNLMAQPMFRTVDSRSALPDNYVRAVTTDSRGYAWLATQSDLVRYDGFSFRSYTLRAADGTMYNNVVRVCQDASGQIWTVTLSNRIFCYDAATDTFADDAQRRLARLGIKEKGGMLTIDADGNLWLTAGCRIYHYVFSRHRLYTSSLASRPVAIVCRRGRAYALTASRQLLRLDMATGRHTLLASHAEMGSNPAVYLSSAGQLFVFDSFKPGLFALNTLAPRGLVRVNSLTVTALADDRQGRLWIATNSDGLVLRASDGSTQSIVHSANDKYSLPTNHISALHISADGVLWVGTSTAGVAIANAGSAGIARVPTPCNADIGCFAEDARGQLWIGFDGAGLLNASTMQLADTTNSALASLLVIGARMEHRDRSLYLGTYGGGIYRLAPDGSLTRQHASCRLVDYARRVITDRHGNQWVSANNNGLCRFAPDGRISQYTMSNSTLRTNAITDMAYDPTADQLLVSTGTGLYSVTCSTAHITPVGDALLGQKVVRVACIDRQRRRWASTTDSIFVYSPSLRLLCAIGLKNVLALAPDLRGDMWATTADAIYRLSPRHLPQIAVRRYAAADGLGDITFYKKALYCTRNGNILAGGYGSYVRIQPQLLTASAARRVVLTRLVVDGNEMVADSAARSGFGCRRGDVVELSVSDLDFSHASPSRFAYRIDGKGDWTAMTANTASLAALSSGSHTIEVGVVDGGDASPLVLHVHVLAPVWLSASAIIVYLIVLAFIVFASFRFMQKRRNRAKRDASKIVESSSPDKVKASPSLPDEASSATNASTAEFVSRATAVVESHLADNDFSVEQFSEEMLHSRSALYKKLMAATGKSPLDFIRAIRLTHGMQLLQQTDMPVAHIAYKTGLSPKQFSKLFKDEYGVLPSQWRKNNNAAE